MKIINGKPYIVDVDALEEIGQRAEDEIVRSIISISCCFCHMQNFKKKKVYKLIYY